MVSVQGGFVVHHLECHEKLACRGAASLVDTVTRGSGGCQALELSTVSCSSRVEACLHVHHSAEAILEIQGWNAVAGLDEQVS
jgi:hypothetical protein